MGASAARSMRRFLLMLALLLPAWIASPGAAAGQAPAPAPSSTRAGDARFEAIVSAAKEAMLSDPPAALRHAAAAARLASRGADARERAVMAATAAWLAAEAHNRMGDAPRAASEIGQAAGLVTRHAAGSRLQADILLTRGGVRVAAGQVAAAMADFHAAHDIFRRLGERRSEARAFVEIANLYYSANDWANALRYFGEALTTVRADPGLSVAVRNGRGLTLMDQGRLAPAAAEFEAAIGAARGMGSPLLTATVLNNAARVRLKQGRVAAAEAALRESRRLAEPLDARAFERSIEALEAQAALQRGDPAAAASLAERAFAGVDLTSTTLDDREAHRTAYEAYRATGDTGRALAHLTAWKRLDDEATALARSNSAALMAARFDFANQEVRIANLKAAALRRSIAFERARARTQQTLLIAGVSVATVIVAMLGFGLFTIRRSRDEVRAANTGLAASNTALEKALAAKTEFLATTSHEIRTPLNGILGMTQVMLADGGVDAATRERVGLVHSAGVTMRALVDDILDVAKMETGHMSVERIGMDLPALIEDAARMWREQAIAKGLTFRVDVSGAPARVMGDPARLRQIVFNLLSNAVKFTGSGDVSVAVARGDAGRYRIVVADTGIGIAPDKHELIFEAFRQADSGTTRQYGGTGLGLAICRNLAHAMDGTVTVASAEGAGATFTVDLPCVEAAAPIATGGLVIDRNPITRATLKSLLEPRLGAIVPAASVEEGAAALVRARVRTIVVDEATLLAAGDPAQAIRTLRRASGEARLFLLWSGDAAAGATVAGEAGATLIRRPIAKPALLAAICDDPSHERPGAPLVTEAA